MYSVAFTFIDQKRYRTSARTSTSVEGENFVGISNLEEK